MLPDFITYPAPIARLLADGGPARLIDDLEAGKTLQDIAARVGMTRGALRRFIASLPQPTQDAIARADLDGVDASVEESRQIADDMAERMSLPMRVITRQGEVEETDAPAQAKIAAAKLQIDTRQWIAERKHKERWGGKADTEVTINFAAIHLDVLRQRHVRSEEVQIVPPPILTAQVQDFL